MSKLTLENINMPELGQRLRDAREQRGLKQDEAAHIISVSRTTMIAIEKGDRRIKPIELAKLATAYGRDINEFLMDPNHYGTADIQFRAPAELTAEEGFAENDRQQFVAICQHFYELERLMKVEISYNYPRPYPTQHMSVNQAAEVIATKERIRLGLGDKPIHHLRRLLENTVGIRVFFLPFDNRIAGMYFYTDVLGACIAVNKGHPVERQRWSLAHEYAHFLIDRYQTDVTIFVSDGYVIKAVSEKIADGFARYFLLPQSSVTTRFEELARESGGKLSAAGLCTIANEFGVSVEAMAVRLESERLITTGKYQELKERGFKPTIVQEKLGLVPVQEEDDVVPQRYRRLAIKAYATGEIDIEQLMVYLGLDDPIQAKRIVYGEAEEFPDLM